MFKDEFYAAIRNDFSDHAADSFIYQYIKKEKENTVSDKKVELTDRRTDYYVAVRQKYEQYIAKHIFQGEYLNDLLLVLTVHKKLFLTEGTRKLILDGGKRLFGQDIYKNARKDRDKFQIISDILKNDPDIRKRNDLFKPKEIERMTEEILDRILQIDVKTFLYDIGYSERTRDSIHHESRKKDRIMDMLSQYCEDNNILFNPRMDAGVRPDKSEYIKECEELYKHLNRDGIRKVFIPLEIDSKTGAGVFIIGRDYYPDKLKKQKKIRGSCCYSVLIFREAIVDENIDEDDDENRTMSLIMEEKSIEETMEDALKCMDANIKSGMALENFQSNNEKRPGAYKGLFDIYFNSDNWEIEMEHHVHQNQQILDFQEEEEEKYLYLKNMVQTKRN